MYLKLSYKPNLAIIDNNIYSQIILYFHYLSYTQSKPFIELKKDCYICKIRHKNNYYESILKL